MESLKKRIEEISDDLKDRIRNPIILTFIIVWLIHHWRLVFILLTFKTYSTAEGLDLIEEYLKKQQISGMIILPVFYAFISLFIFYIIGVLVQYMRESVAIKWRAEIISNISPSKYVTKEKHNKEKKHSATLQQELSKANDENQSLTNYKAAYEKNYNELKNQHDNLAKNVRNNSAFIENMERTMLVLLARSLKKNIDKMHKKNNIAMPWNQMNGTWTITTTENLAYRSGDTKILIFDSDKVLTEQGKEYGIIKDAEYDVATLTLSFFILVSEGNSYRQSYNLIKLNMDEYTGFSDAFYCYMKRKKE